jgi:hypothetical protein
MLPLGELCDAILGYLLEILIKLIGLVGCNFRVWGPWKTEALRHHTGCPPAGTAGPVYHTGCPPAGTAGPVYTEY